MEQQQMTTLTDTELATRWGMTTKTLYRWRTQNRGPRYLKLGKKILYPLTAVEEYEKQITVDVGFASTPARNPRASQGLIHAAALSIC
jgi:predicted DNA-binding transcriptional regulator AlpA